MCSPNRKKWSPKSGNVEPKLLVCFCYGSAVQASVLLTSLSVIIFLLTVFARQCFDLASLVG